MKKNRYLCAAAFVTAFCVLVNSQAFGTSTEYNDKNYKTYNNLTEDSTVPSLFKNDDIFTNYKDYPPVISDGVEYVPLELFCGLSNVKINYSEDNSNFYIQNKKTNEYISFNITDNYAVTGENRVYETNTPTYYGVRYVPLRAVCDTVSIGCSTYNDGENRMYAIEIYTGDESLSAQDLLKIHAPDLYSTGEAEADVPPEEAQKPIESSPGADTQGNTGSMSPVIPENTYPYYPGMGGYLPADEVYPGNIGTGSPEQTTSQYPSSGAVQNTDEKSTQNNESSADEKKEQPKAPEYKSGKVMLFYTPESFANAEKTLDALDLLGIKAAFFVTEADILSYPGTIRRIYTSGHTIGITFSEDREELFAENVLEEKISSAENALYEVAKIKTRILYLGEISRDTELPEEILTRIQSLGLCAVRLNGDARTDTLNPKKAGEKMRSDLLDIRRNFGSDTACIRLQHTDSAISAAGAVAAVCAAHRVVKAELFDETDIQRR